MSAPEICQLDRGPHARDGRWRYVVGDGERVTTTHMSPAEAWAAWERGDTRPIPPSSDTAAGPEAVVATG